MPVLAEIEDLNLIEQLPVWSAEEANTRVGEHNDARADVDTRGMDFAVTREHTARWFVLATKQGPFVAYVIGGGKDITYILVAKVQ